MLKRELDDLQAKIQRLEKRAIEQKAIRDRVLKILKDKFGVETIEEAKTLLAEKKSELETAEKSLEARYEQFTQKFAKLLQIA